MYTWRHFFSSCVGDQYEEPSFEDTTFWTVGWFWDYIDGHSSLLPSESTYLCYLGRMITVAMLTACPFTFGLGLPNLWFGLTPGKDSRWLKA